MQADNKLTGLSYRPTVSLKQNEMSKVKHHKTKRRFRLLWLCTAVYRAKGLRVRREMERDYCNFLIASQLLSDDNDDDNDDDDDEAFVYCVFWKSVTYGLW